MLSKKPVLIVISLLISIFLWIYVTGQVDPETSARIYDIPVTITNTDKLADLGLAVADDGDLTTSVVVKGKRSVINQAKSDGLTAELDVSSAEKGSNDLTLKFNTPSGLSIDSSSTPVYTIKVQERVSKDVPVYVEFTSSKNSKLQGYATGVYPKTVKIYGAKSIVKKVEAASTKIDSDKLREKPKNLRTTVTAVNSKGDEVSCVEYSRKRVYVDAQLLHKKEVSVNVKTKNVPSGYKVSQIGQTSTITVLGTEAAIKNIESVNATADMSDVDSADVYTEYVDINLPYNIYLAKETKLKVDITVEDKDN